MTATIKLCGIEFDVEYTYVPPDPKCGAPDEYILHKGFIQGTEVRLDDADADAIIDKIIEFEDENYQEAIREGHRSHQRKLNIY